MVRIRHRSRLTSQRPAYVERRGGEKIDDEPGHYREGQERQTQPLEHQHEEGGDQDAAAPRPKQQVPQALAGGLGRRGGGSR